MLQQKSYTPGTRAQRRKAKVAVHKHPEHEDVHLHKKDTRTLGYIIGFVLLVAALLILVPFWMNR